MLLFTVSSLKKITLFWINSNTAKIIHLLLQMKYQQWQMQEPCIKARKAHVQNSDCKGRNVSTHSTETSLHRFVSCYWLKYSNKALLTKSISLNIKQSNSWGYISKQKGNGLCSNANIKRKIVLFSKVKRNTFRLYPEPHTFAFQTKKR